MKGSDSADEEDEMQSQSLRSNRKIQRLSLLLRFAAFVFAVSRWLRRPAFLEKISVAILRAAVNSCDEVAVAKLMTESALYC